MLHLISIINNKNGRKTYIFFIVKLIKYEQETVQDIFQVKVTESSFTNLSYQESNPDTQKTVNINWKYILNNCSS